MSQFHHVFVTDYGTYKMPESVPIGLVKFVPLEADLIQGCVTIAVPDRSDELSRKFAEWEENEFKRADEAFAAGEEYKPSEWPY